MSVFYRFKDLRFWCLLVPSFTSVVMLLLTQQQQLTGLSGILLVFLNACFVMFGVKSFCQDFSTKLGNLSTVVDALKHQDYSVTIKPSAGRDVYAKTANNLNQIVTQLAEQSLLSKERQVLLGKITNHIDTAIVACDHKEWVTLMNPAAEKLFKLKYSTVTNIRLSDFNLPFETVLTEPSVITIDQAGTSHKVYLSTDVYFEHGKKQQLYFFTDVQKLLFDEERKTWQRLIRVLSHELNNSLAPITSISHSLSKLLVANCLKGEVIDDLADGIGVINERSKSLATFLNSYEKFTKLPPAERRPVEIKSLLNKVSQLFPAITVDNRVNCQQVYVDPVQIEQVILNIFKNASEAMEGISELKIKVSAQRLETSLIISICDQGKGIHNIDNLFVPFYSTKPNGSGIGLVLSRMIASNNDGDLILRNNRDGVGATAFLQLPLIETL